MAGGHEPLPGGTSPTSHSVRQMYIETHSLCSGNTFGACPRGERQPASAIADSRIVLFQISRADIRSRLGEVLEPLWRQPLGLQPDAAVRCAVPAPYLAALTTEL